MNKKEMKQINIFVNLKKTDLLAKIKDVYEKEDHSSCDTEEKIKEFIEKHIDIKEFLEVTILNP